MLWSRFKLRPGDEAISIPDESQMTIYAPHTAIHQRGLVYGSGTYQKWGEVCCHIELPNLLRANWKLLVGISRIDF